MSTAYSPIPDNMSLIESVAGIQAAETMSKVQMAVAAKVLQTSRDQGQMVVELINSAMEGMEEAIEKVASEVGSNLDAFG